MSIFGYVDFENLSGGAQQLRQMSEAAGRCGTSQDTHAGTGHAFGARRGSLEYLKEADVTVALEGQPRWTDGFIEKAAKFKGAPYAVIEGYVRYGQGLFDRIRGSFCLALLDGKRGRGLIASDRTGQQTLYYAICDSRLVFGTRVRAVLANAGVPDALDSQALFNYLYFHVVPTPRTIYTAVKRLAPGAFLLFERGKAREVPYWEPDFTEHAPHTTELESELKSLLRESVRRSINGKTTGAFLSGGTDSSTVVGMLNAVTGTSPRTYSIGFNARNYDETAFARTAARHFHADHHEYFLTPEDVIEAVPRVAAYYDQPFGNASAVPVYYCARMAKSDGVTRLLAGDGGDEIFGGNRRYAKQNLFERYANLPAVLRKAVIEPLLFGIPAGDRLDFIRKARSYVRQANVPLPARLETYNLLMRCGGSATLTADFIREVNAEEPTQLIEDIYGKTCARGKLNGILGLDMRITLGDNDLCKVSGMCALAGVEVAYPMLDDNLVAFALQLPERYKVKGSILRYFFKQALSDFLPKEVLTKTKHGFGLPFGVWLQSHSGLNALARDSLESLKKRGIVRPEFLDKLFLKHHSEHSAYYGTMIWVLMMLEQWYATRSDA